MRNKKKHLSIPQDETGKKLIELLHQFSPILNRELKAVKQVIQKQIMEVKDENTNR